MNNIGKHLLVLAIVCPLLLVVFAADDDVLDLSANDSPGFKSEVGKHDTVLVEFFAPWCGHCKRLAPEYAKAATALKSHDPPVPLAKIDCTTDQGKDLCQEYGVSGYPTLKIFKAGEFATEYSGPRDADGIIKYMRSQVGPASKHHQSFAKLKDGLEAAKDVLVVGVFGNEKDSMYKKYAKAADKLRESVNFAHVFSDSASDGAASVALLKDLSAPAVVLVRPKSLHNKFEDSHVVYDGSSDIDEFVSKSYHGLVGHRTQTNMAEFKQPLIVAYYDVDYVKNAKGTNYWRNRILKVAKNYKDEKLTFAVANAASFAGEMEEYGFEAGRSGRDAPPMVAARDKDNKKYVMKEKFSVETFEQFVKDFQAGNLEAHIKSEELPDNEGADVKTAVAKNFDELVINSDKDVLVEFYAPWCGHCKKLAPVWEELGKALKDEDSVEIVKMDATANDVSGPFVVHGFPTIYWYPSGSKHAKKYEGGREVNDFIEYIAKYSTQELNKYDRDGKPKAGKTEL